ncbi:hypothetical protein DW202_13965 [Coprobacillus sp. AM17-34]|uniref:Uncharacterized protein n=2 Tax=Faecalibacillus intestinalis TaxID=1982626 RepID=A0AAW4VL01_9FIRM|nr:hypothetical protein [Faecalibacillus intestinalis]MCB8562987.1 hypothetical protein [Faecalibacillus intestinalis]MCG4811128.1 hypothetical protein [Faecalibacillus intestinalis]RHO30310.1 hypothetical protein DW202_13965 [Coprobacillus sp. AM17-34]
MKHLSTLIAVKNLTIIQFTKIIQDLFYLDEFILDSLIIHLENCTIYHDESAIAFCIQYQNNDYEYIFNETKQNIYLSINKRNNQFIDLITYLDKCHLLNNDHFSYIQPNIKNMNDLNQVIEFVENKTILPVIYLNMSLKDFKNEILNEIQSTAYILTSEDENFHQAFQKHFHLRNNSYILYLNHEFQKISFLKKESPQEFIEKVKIKIQSYVLQRTYSFPYNMKDFQHHVIKKIIENHKENDFLENSSIEQQVLALEDKKKNLQKNIDDLNNQILILENQNEELGSYIKQQGYYPLILKGNEKEFYKGEQRDLLLYLLKEELKNNHNQKQQQIIHTILEQNPSVGNRNRYLTDIFNLLVNEGLSKKSIDTLSRYGIILSHTGKHPTTTFFNDSRYTMTFSSTPSDLNVGRQYYRQIRKLFF